MNIEERIAQANQGREFWLRLVKEQGINNICQVVLLPEKGKVYWESALKYLPDFLKKRHAKRGIVLTCQKELPKKYHETDDNIAFVVCKPEELQALIQFYCLYEFAPNLVIASLEEPAGRLGYGMIGHKNCSLEEVFTGVVYGLVDEEA